jgi:hypothetical protein
MQIKVKIKIKNKLFQKLRIIYYNKKEIIQKKIRKYKTILWIKNKFKFLQLNKKINKYLYKLKKQMRHLQKHKLQV